MRLVALFLSIMLCGSVQVSAQTGTTAEATGTKRVPGYGETFRDTGKQWYHKAKEMTPSLASLTQPVRNSLASFSWPFASSISSFTSQLDQFVSIETIGNALKSFQRWEYKVVLNPEADPQKLEETLNSFGQEGWDCFSIIQTDKGSRFHFKRKPVFKKRELWVVQLFLEILGSYYRSQ
jgi:hypothetical protein